jgi:hypothetical protein
MVIVVVVLVTLEAVAKCELLLKTGTIAAQQSVTEFIALIVVNLITTNNAN